MPTPHHHASRQVLLAVLTTTLATISAPVTSFANGTRLPNQDAEATARGNAFVATADNPSAIYYNPAGLTQLPGLQVQSNAYIISARYDYTPAGGGSTVKAERDVAVVPQLYVSFTPEDSPLSYGLGVYSPFGQASEWPASSGFDSIATRNEITFITLAPTIAWKISEHLSVGAGLQINRVDADLNNSLLAFEGDDTSFGYNLGIMWHLNERHVVGLNYQSRSTSRFEGTAKLPLFGVSSPGTLDLAFPDVITLGYSWRPTPAWNLEIAIDRTNWDLLNTATLEHAFGPTSIPFNWEASYYYLFGVTRHLSDGWRLSAGYCYSENSVPSATFNPAVPDMNRHIASIGIGRKIGAISGYFTYQHTFKSSRTVQGAPTSLLAQSPDGRYESTLNAVSLSFRYDF